MLEISLLWQVFFCLIRVLFALDLCIINQQLLLFDLFRISEGQREMINDLGLQIGQQFYNMRLF